MRKLMASTIIILPLILLAILLVSGAILSLATYIYVENIEFVDKNFQAFTVKDMTTAEKINIMDQVNVFPINARNKDLIFSSSDPLVATIDANGIITPVFYGETTITVTSRENVAAKAEKVLIFTDTSVHQLKFKDTVSDLYEGDTFKLSVSIYPQEASNKIIDWTSSDNDILEVGADGTVTAKGNGDVTVTATSRDNTNGIIKTSTTISCHAKLKSISFDKSKSILETSMQSINFPRVTTTPANCDVTYAYSSSNSDIATVSKDGLVTFTQAGLVTVTVTVTDYRGNSKTDELKFLSTMGHFADTLFSGQAEINYDDCLGLDHIPVNLNPIPDQNAYLEILSVECGLDSEVTGGGHGDPNVITYDNVARQFKVVGGGDLPAFNNFIHVLVHAKVYSRETNTLSDTTDSFYITKAGMQNNSKVFLGGDELSSSGNNTITITNIGEQVSLRVENPENWVVTPPRSNGYVNVTYSGNTLTLTSLDVCDGETIALQIGNKSFTLVLKFTAKAEKLTVTSGDITISNGNTYHSLLDSVTFSVTKSRTDGKTIASPIKYQLNNEGDLQDVTDGTLTVSTDHTDQIKFFCDEQVVSFYLRRGKIEDFDIQPSFNTTSGDTQELDLIENVAINAQTTITLPSNGQNNLILNIRFDTSTLLGGFGTNADFGKLFNIDLGTLKDSDWSVNYNASAKNITVNFTGTEFNEEFTLTCGEISLVIQLVKVNIERISFTNKLDSFDMSLDGDVHKGYQQVRVFAKHSYYDGKTVDFFRIPLSALTSITDDKSYASADTISWTLTRYVGDRNAAILTSQLGDLVIIDNKTYRIEKSGDEYVLKDGDQVVSGVGGENSKGYIWVDAYTESADGYARIYFGNFGGLSESDVYNDYFGNFDNMPDYTTPEVQNDTKGGGVIVTPSEGAYSFLRIEAGDGVVGSKNCYFNFNVLADPDDITLVNVVNADGYYNNDNVVLQNNLYGVGELGTSGDLFDKATAQNLFLSNKDKLDKSTIFGNGYQVNLNAMNESFSSKDENSGVKIHKAYNAVIKGSNPIDEISSTKQKFVLMMSYAYYCDLSYYYKLRTADNAIYVKNTVFSCIPKAAIQLYKNEPLYVENITIVETGVGILIDDKNKHNPDVYLKGNIDILNFNNKTGLEGMNPLVGMMYSTVVANVKDYLEWHGTDTFTIYPSGTSQTDTETTDRAYVNVLMFVMGDITSTVKVWQNGSYVLASGVELSNGAKIVNKELAFGYYAWTYEILDENGQRIDHAKVELIDPKYVQVQLSQDEENIFSEDRYIRLQCEYTEKGVKNEQHILWHKQQVYRNVTLQGVTDDHIMNLRTSIHGNAR